MKEKDIEVTCEVFEDIPTIIKTLESNGFNYVEEFTLDDIYMGNYKNQEFLPQNGKITDTLIIRYVNENDKKIICKRRQYNNNGFEISTEKSVLKIESIENAEKHLNMLGYTKYLRMIDKNYKYANNDFIAYIQEIKELGTFLEIEVKNEKDMCEDIDILIEYVKSLNLKTGTKYDIRKAEMFYKKQKNHLLINELQFKKMQDNVK